jgi:hypothetical protein
MKIIEKNPSREFKVGCEQSIVLKDCGNIFLETNEQVTFLTADNAEYDVCRKEWGYYATPSVNDRLKRFGFKTAVVKNSKGQVFVMLVEKEKAFLFFEYLEKEDNVLVQWLDDLQFPVDYFANESFLCPVCFSSGVTLVKVFDKAPHGETNFSISNYHRELYQCLSCKHVYNINCNLEQIYEGDYADCVYKDEIEQTFKKIISLPDEKSDNTHRVTRVIEFMKSHKCANPLVLDIGSGLCVFLYKLKQQTGWECLALDPDSRQAEHAQKVCGIKSVCCAIENYIPAEKFDFVTLNKVLEHFKDPLSILEKVKGLVNNGYIYIEVPDGEEALLDSSDREEFFIEHHHAFSLSSLHVLLSKAGLLVLNLSRIIEPSGKYTLYAFCKVQ